MSSSGQQDHWPVVWIGPNDILPNTCMTCGMFTDVRTKVTVAEQTTEMVNATDSSQVAMGCLLHLLGPIGLLITAIDAATKKEPKQKVAKTRITKHTVRVPQCRLCTGMKRVEAVGSGGNGISAFHVHPNFFDRFRADNPHLDRDRFIGPTL
jgi:hypothetical protein